MSDLTSRENYSIQQFTWCSMFAVCFFLVKQRKARKENSDFLFLRTKMKCH